jgi:hypothetical protein
MILNLLFTAFCLVLALIVGLDANAPRRMQRVRVSREDRDRRNDPVRRD